MNCSKKIMRLSDINVPSIFLDSTPKEEKVESYREYWNLCHKQAKYIVVNKDNILMDGYIQYLVLKENNVLEAHVKIANRVSSNYKEIPTTYVFGIHPNSLDQSEYVWRIPNEKEYKYNQLEIGDTIYCETKFGASPVIVTRIERRKNSPVTFEVKKVFSLCKKVK